MEKLLQIKLNRALELKDFTNKIKDLNLKTQYDLVDSMIEERQNLLENIREIDNRIKEERNKENFVETDEIKELTKEIKQVFMEVSEIDNIIRKNINKELKIIRGKLNQPEVSKTVNIKA